MASTDDASSFVEHIQTKLKHLQEDKQLLRESLQTINTKIKNLISRRKHRPSESLEELTQEEVQLEYSHATNPQSRVEERNFMTQKEKLKRKKKELIEYNILEDEIKQLKAQRVAIGEELDMKEGAINDLQTALQKMKVSTLHNCRMIDVCEYQLSIPSEKLSHVIGKGGSTIKQIEADYLVTITVNKSTVPNSDSSDATLIIYGLNAGIQDAVAYIQTISSVTDHEIQLSKPVTEFLLIEKSILSKLQNDHNVKIFFKKETCDCKVVGQPRGVLAAVDYLSSLDCKKYELDIEKSAVKTILSQGAEFLKGLRRDEIRIFVDEEKLKINIFGLAQFVNVALKDLKDYLEDNKEMSLEINADENALRTSSIGTSLRELQPKYHVGVSVVIGEASKVVITGARRRVLEAKLNAEEILRLYESQCITIYMPEYIMPIIIGKKGQKISEFREQHPNCNIHQISRDKNTPGFQIHCVDDEARSLAAQAIRDIVDANYKREIALDKETLHKLKSAKGDELRNTLQNVLELNVDINFSSNSVILRGKSGNIEEAEELISQFAVENSTSDITMSSDDVYMFKSLKERGFLDEFEARNQVKILRFNNTLKFTGHQENVDTAIDQFRLLLDGTSTRGESVLIPIEENELPAFIGKKGENIKNLENKLNVTIDVLKSLGRIRIIGEQEAVSHAKEHIILFLDQIDLKESIELDANGLEKAKKVFPELLFNFDVVTTVESDTVLLQGKKRLVEQAIIYLRRSVDSQVRDTIKILDQQASSFSESSIEQLRNKLASFGTNVVIDKVRGEINLTSNNLSNLSKAKTHVFKVLNFMFPRQFGSVHGRIHALLLLWNAETEMAISKLSTTAKVTVDTFSSCIQVCDHQPETVDSIVNDLSNALARCEKLRVSIESTPQVIEHCQSKRKQLITPIEQTHSVKIRLLNSPATITLIGKDEHQIDASRRDLEHVLEKISREMWHVQLNKNLFKQFITGNYPKSLRDKTGVDLKLQNESGRIDIKGDASSVQKAKEMISSFIDENNVSKLTVVKEAVPIIIGTKGAAIQELTKKHGLRNIQIDKVNFIVNLVGKKESCIEAEAEIRKILASANIILPNPVVTAVEEVKVKEEVVEEPEEEPSQAHEDQINLSKSTLRRLKRKEKKQDSTSQPNNHPHSATSNEGESTFQNADDDDDDDYTPAKVESIIPPNAVVEEAKSPVDTHSHVATSKDVSIPQKSRDDKLDSSKNNSNPLLDLLLPKPTKTTAPTSTGDDTILNGNGHSSSFVQQQHDTSSKYFSSRSGISFRLS